MHFNPNSFHLANKMMFRDGAANGRNLIVVSKCIAKEF